MKLSCALQSRSNMIRPVDIETEGHMTFLLLCTCQRYVQGQCLQRQDFKLCRLIDNFKLEKVIDMGLPYTVRHVA